MRAILTLFSLALCGGLSGLGSAPSGSVDIDHIADEYCAEFCNSSLNLPVPSTPSERYREDFLARLRITEDRELKRLCALFYLHSSLQSEIASFEKGEGHFAKVPRKLSAAERADAAKRLSERLSDLAALDPKDSDGTIGKLKDRLKKAGG